MVDGQDSARGTADTTDSSGATVDATDGARAPVHVTDTAQPIASVRAEESLRPAAERWFDDPYASLFAGAGGDTPVARRMASAPFFREAVRARTRYLDDAVRRALSDGIRQIVLLGAGFDCRGLRLPEIAAASARVLEVDFATQLAAKRSVLEQAGVRLPASVRHVPCDLADPGFAGPLTRALEGDGFRRDEPALFLWEGVVGYLDDATFTRSLDLIVALAGRGGRLAFNYGLNRFLPDDLDARLERAGLRVLEDVDLGTLYRRWAPGELPPGGELYRVVTAQREGDPPAIETTRGA